ncbi:MAG: UbiA family prenyltransferase [Planctomycetes bacterium]|nr:UbiA family prenyltransferase [Planctomycetota bacterium]
MPGRSSLSRLRPYAQLVRLPNVFTALADIALGALAVRRLNPGISLSRWWWTTTMLLAASACLYCAGMVWNDFFDLEQDRRERPFRPLPSGRITRTAAGRFGAGLLGAGLLFALLAGWQAGRMLWLPGILAVLLAGAILLYDGWLKRTWAGPPGMGTCRFLNVLLGLSAGNRLLGHWGVDVAVVVGLYIVGVTWFARTEARLSRRRSLIGAALVMLAALMLALPLPEVVPEFASQHVTSPLFPYLLVLLGFLVGLPVCRAIAWPSPLAVQPAVKRAILGLVVLDAVLATTVAGVAGLGILVLLLPALYLGRWIYST